MLRRTAHTLTFVAAAVVLTIGLILLGRPLGFPLSMFPLLAWLALLGPISGWVETRWRGFGSPTVAFASGAGLGWLASLALPAQ